MKRVGVEWIEELIWAALRNFRKFGETSKIRARIQGFADRSEDSKEGGDELLGIAGIFNKLQPISVGVGRRLPSSFRTRLRP